MKKITLCLLCLAWAFWSCEIPESITIKGKPTVFIPLGSPFEEGNRLEDQISPEAIKEMMGGDETDDSAVRVYDYPYYADIQTYLIHYPITRMELDLSEHIQKAMDNNASKSSYTIPSNIANLPPAAFPPGGYFLTGLGGPQIADNPADPLFTVPLADMAKLVISIDGKELGLELDISSGATFNKDSIRIKIPAFGIDDYVEGVPVGSKLRFTNDADPQFIPKSKSEGGHLNENNELEIFVKILQPCSGTISPEMVFEWNEAVINTAENGSLAGKYIIQNSLEEYLGGAALTKARAYIYAEGVGDSATMSLWADNITDMLVEQDSPLTPKTRPDFPSNHIDPFIGELPEDSLEQDPIDLTDILAQQNVILDYQINIPQMTITPDETVSKIIAVDMVIVFPLEFQVSAPTDDPEYMNTHVKLDMGHVLPQPDGKDILGRESKNDGLFSNFKTVKITLIDLERSILEGNKLGVLLVANYPPGEGGGSHKHLLAFSDDEPFISLDMETLPYPFSPRFEIIMEKDSGEDFATLIIGRNKADEGQMFDFSLAIEVKTDINETIEF